MIGYPLNFLMTSGKKQIKQSVNYLATSINSWYNISAWR